MSSLKENEKIKYVVVGSRRISVYFWAVALTLGGIGFTLAGLSSYLGRDLLPFSSPSTLIFIPQGIAMFFYGVLGTGAGIYQWLTLYWDLGGGYNEFNKEEGQITIFRKGFPGSNRELKLGYQFSEIQSVQVQLKEGLNPRRAIFLRTKGGRTIPLTGVGQPQSLSEIENEAANIARILSVPLEGI
jgi:hypothetical protein